MANEMFEGITIPDGLLKAIAGGVLSDDLKYCMMQMMPLVKAQGHTKEEAIASFRNTITNDPALLEDSVAYIEEIWDSI